MICVIAQSKHFPDRGMFAAGDVVEHSSGGVGFAFTSDKAREFGLPNRIPLIRNAHLAESQAELCAHNVRSYLQQRRHGT